MKAVLWIVMHPTQTHLAFKKGDDIHHCYALNIPVSDFKEINICCLTSKIDGRALDAPVLWTQDPKL